MKPAGKRIDTAARDVGMAFAVAIRYENGGTREEAISAVATLARVSYKTVEACFTGDMRRLSQEWAADPARRRLMLATAEPFL